MTATIQHPATCHICNAQLSVLFVDCFMTASKVMTAVLPVPPARDCAVCGDVTCSDCTGDACPHVEVDE